jgi:RNA polymerase sigma-70 factor, ECF subfamily
VRRAVRDVPVDDRTIAALQGATHDPRLEHLKATYRAQFAEAWRASLRALSPDDRTLLRLHVVDRVAVDRLGALYGVHATTAARRVRQVKERLATQVHETLQGMLEVTPDELASILALIQSEIDITLGELLSAPC